MTAPRTWSTPAMLRSRLVRAYQRIGRLRAIKREVFAALEKTRKDLDQELDRVRRRDVALQVQVDHNWAQTRKLNALEDELKKVRQLAVDELTAQQRVIDALEAAIKAADKKTYTQEHAREVIAAYTNMEAVKARTC